MSEDDRRFWFEFEGRGEREAHAIKFGMQNPPDLSPTPATPHNGRRWELSMECCARTPLGAMRIFRAEIERRIAIEQDCPAGFVARDPLGAEPPPPPRAPIDGDVRVSPKGEVERFSGERQQWEKPA